MKRTAWRRSASTAALAVVLASTSGLAPVAGARQIPQEAAGCATDDRGVERCTGTIANGAPYTWEIPSNWNGTLLVYSRGGPVVIVPALDAPRGVSAWLLQQGYALLGSSYSAPGWAVAEGPADQVATMDAFEGTYGKPTRTIAWGESLGGSVTHALIQRYPARFDGALPLCNAGGGMAAQWNQLLDATFALKTLQAPTSSLALVNLPRFPAATPDATAADALVTEAQKTAAGRARVAMAAAFNNAPLWVDPADPEPVDLAGQQAQMAKALRNAIRLGMSVPRQEIELRAGGNFSWNTGVDYAKQLALSGRWEIVSALYQQAGLSLEQDLRTLQAAPRVAGNAAAVAYAKANVAPNGVLSFPVLTMNTTGDPSALPAHEQAYAATVSATGSAGLLRQTFVNRAGHCNFTPAEYAGALLTLEARLDTGTWGDSTRPEALNATAASTDLPGGTRFVSYRPDQFLRPCSLLEARCEGEP
ncbi:MAG: hypothetical protein HYX52_07665 [Chloroflexi bacterium]|nr:hypothetical protein [Chloroflexota bacterium]